MRTVLDARTSSGYASRSRDGIHGILDVETALAAAERISGPAARRAIAAVAEAPRFAGRLVTKNFARQQPPTSPATGSSCSTTPTAA